ncbi:MAG TPA: hypothetical protein VFG35_19895 [Actinoplanes sp.]|nr:hypothetical protein [Actinoplanes sp.]
MGFVTQIIDSTGESVHSLQMPAKPARQNTQRDREILRPLLLPQIQLLDSDVRPLRHLLMVRRKEGHDLRK